MVMVRGSNPVWLMDDLVGNLLDDEYYMFVLQNEIPYNFATVWSDPNGNVPIANPINFEANGTLPINIYFDPDVVYRLEIRRGNTQQDPLIYLIENYVPGTGGSSPSGDSAIVTDNQVTNAQFSLINFQSPLVVTSVTDPDPISVAPGWTLNLTGTGNYTVTQVPLTDSATTVNPTNAPYALRVTLTGTWTDAYLAQRFEQNGNLWSTFDVNRYVSNSITARVQGAASSVTGVLVNSEDEVLATVLSTTSITESWNEYVDYGLMPEAQDATTPPAAYIEYRLVLQNTVDIFLTSFQLISGYLPTGIAYSQDSIQRQIDHTYHLAYPIVPVGAIIDFGGFVVPQHYLLCDGSAYNRITYNLLFQSLTTTETVTLTSTVNTFTVASSANYHIGMAIEGTGIPASTTITNIVGTTITISNAATVTGSQSVRFFAWGPGDGSTTFNTPNLLDYVTAGANGSLFGAGNNAVGATGGSATHTLTIAEMPSHNHPGSTVAINQVLGAASTVNQFMVSGGATAVSVAAQGGGAAFPIVQQTAFVKKCIRFE